MLTDAQRRGLYAALEDALGPEPATSMMGEIAQIDWSNVARRSDIDNLRTELHGEMIERCTELKSDIGALRADMVGLRSELKGDIGALRVELKGEVADLRHELIEFRAEMRSKFDGLVARQLVANVPLAFGVAGLVLAAAKLT